MAQVDCAISWLPQAGWVAHSDFVDGLTGAGYLQHNLFTIADGSQFTLVVNDFRVKYIDKTHAHRFVDILPLLTSSLFSWNKINFSTSSSITTVADTFGVWHVCAECLR